METVKVHNKKWEIGRVPRSSTCWNLLADYAARDHRIRLARNEANLGLIRSLNRGLEIARGEFVARIDADDLSRPERLERQVSFFNGNPDHVLVGASYDAIDSQGRVLWSKVTELDDVQVRWIARFRIPLGHSGAMFRRLDEVAPLVELSVD